ncbi:hypothetical protein C8N43_0747 [Litoreibacter ponti]|uniref:Uncharacterized protein n=2 Tax=Litoreibacter ponti TaxID=1510457 RepID=A0A2T6BJ69_9RHOB|nr:hypothetical protein C8N43_0747 [Litoreibacter ponti]
MACLDDLPEKTRTSLLTLFRARNFCFATHEQGRTPTFYFATGGPTRLQYGFPNGRLRTMHGRGPLIEICATMKHHWFFSSKKKRDDARLAAKACKDRAELARLMDKMRKVPKKGYHHYEFLKGASWTSPVGVGHRSGGKVDLTRITSDAKIEAILNDMLEYDCWIQVGKTKLQLTEGAPRPTREANPRSVRTYLDDIG